MEAGHGLQIVSVTKSHSYVLEENELENLLLHEDVKDLPVVVVSVAGAYRGGKSFLLNFFLKYLSAESSAREDGSWLSDDNKPLSGFVWRSGIKATTMGVLMWSKPFITTLPSGEKVAVLLVDTQGTFDSKSTVRDCSTIFALSTLVSSVQIYNLSQDIKEDDLQHLELFTEYGKLVNADSKTKAFQVLEFLVRDWRFDDDGIHPYGMVGGERLLNERLEITDDLAKDMKELREHVRSSFEKVSCFLMPHPGFNVFKSNYDGNIQAIDSDFKKHLIDLINSIFGPNKLLPKTINGERVKARELFNYFKTYMELFNSDKIPSPTNILVATVKAGLLSAVSEAHDIYEKGMDSECGPEQLSVPAVDLKFLHEKYVKLATDFYTNKKKMGSAKEIAEYLEELTKELNDRFPQFIQSNLSKIQTAINRANEAYDDAIEKISKDQLFCVHPKDLEQIHNASVDAAMRIYDAGRKRVTPKFEDERAVFKQGFQKRYDLQQKINNQNNTNVVTEIRMEYWQRMQRKTAVDPPLSSAEFRQEHNIALRKALENFDAKRNIPSHYTEDVYKYNLTQGVEESFTDLISINKSKNIGAVMAAIEEYDSYMHTFWSKGIQCLHPKDLEEAHRKGLCVALQKFRPKKECSSGFDTEDEDEARVNEVIMKRYKDSENRNHNANETVIVQAYNKFVSAMENSRRSALMWSVVAAVLAVIDFHTLAFTLPLGVSANNKEKAGNEARQKALEVFYGQRRRSDYGSGDSYRDRLDEKMNTYLESV